MLNLSGFAITWQQLDLTVNMNFTQTRTGHGSRKKIALQEYL